jgi:uncharacterized membrane protein
MPSNRTAVVGGVALGCFTLGHAVLTWPRAAVVVFFGGGALVAFVAEAVAIAIGLLEHHVEPTVLGVPVYVLFAWTGVMYVALRPVSFVFDGAAAVVVTATLATTYDLSTDHRGVEDGLWSYTDDLPGPRVRGVPWWNFVGWFVVAGTTAALTVSVL